jgi:hypothetical protein
MAQSRLIEDYRAALLAGLPASLADEVSDGLYEANDKYVRQGLTIEDAAVAAVTEFGEPRAVIDGFIRVSPARRAARTLIATGPLVGLCWAAELITGRAWHWPVPVIAPILLGTLLAASVSMLMTAGRTRRYDSVRRSGVVGCAGLIVLDVSMIATVLVVAPGAGWAVLLAMCASAARLTGVVRAMRPMLA